MEKTEFMYTIKYGLTDKNELIFIDKLIGTQYYDDKKSSHMTDGSGFTT